MMSQSRGLRQYMSQSKGRMHTNAKQSERKQTKKQNKCCHFNDSARPNAARSHLYQTIKP